MFGRHVLGSKPSDGAQGVLTVGHPLVANDVTVANRDCWLDEAAYRDAHRAVAALPHAAIADRLEALHHVLGIIGKGVSARHPVTLARLARKKHHVFVADIS